MTSAKAASGAKASGAAARSEVNGGSPVVKWNGLRLPLKYPALPGSWALELDDVSDVVFIKRVFEPEQVEAIKRQMDADEVSFEDAPALVVEIVEAVMEAYGVNRGE